MGLQQQRWMEEAEAEGKAELLLKLLALRFGTIGGEAEDRIRTASDADLDRWTERVRRSPAGMSPFRRSALASARNQ